jgi:hypothetical protein
MIEGAAGVPQVPENVKRSKVSCDKNGETIRGKGENDKVENGHG